VLLAGKYGDQQGGMMETEMETLTVEEAAFLLKVGTPTVESLIRRGLLPVEERSGTYQIRRQELVAFMRRNQREIEQNDDAADTAQDFGVMGERTDE
jgi:excisionase family DNA binding protein